MVIIVALYIILGIVALLVFVFAVRVRVTIDMADEMRLWITVCGVRINILPKKPKKYKLSDYTLKKIAKRDKKKAEKDAKKAAAKALKKKKKAQAKQKKKEEQARLTKAEKKAIKAHKKASSPPLPSLISLLLDTLGFFFPNIFGKFHFHVARIKLRIGGSDAAQTALLYYTVTNALGPILDFIDKHAHLHGRRCAEIDIAPDFLSDEIKADVKLGFSTSLGAILGSLLKTAFKAAFGYIKIKPSSPPPPRIESKNEKDCSDGASAETSNVKKTSEENQKK